MEDFVEARRNKMKKYSVCEKVNFKLETKDRFLISGQVRQTDLWRFRLEDPGSRHLFVE